MNVLSGVMMASIMQSIADFFYWLVGRWIIWFVTLFEVLRAAVQAWAEILFASVLPHLFPSVDWTPWNGYLANLNYFLPFNEGVVVVGGLILLWVSVALYRVVKSCLPSVSS